MARKRQYTAWAAALATAAELSRRSYDVTITFGNTPKVDLLCSVPDGKQFKVQVKGISSRNALFIQKDFLEGTLEPNLFLVIVLLEDNKPFQFFIMTHAEAQDAWRATAYDSTGSPVLVKRGQRKGLPTKEGCEGLLWGSFKNHENRWDKFPKNMQ
jgi:hypothetical protein